MEQNPRMINQNPQKLIVLAYKSVDKTVLLCTLFAGSTYADRVLLLNRPVKIYRICRI